MRQRFGPLAALLLVVAAIAAACGGSSSGSDPYDLLSKAKNADWSPLQINVGVAVKDGETNVTIEPAAIGVVIDEAAGSGAVHVAIPVAGLGLSASDLADFGVTGDSLDLDVIWTKDGAYAKSPALGALLTMVLSGSGELPSGDLTGWLRLGTAAELESLMELLGSSVSMTTPPPAGDAAALKKQLEDSGIVLQVAGTQQHNGIEATHITATLDFDKLMASDYAKNAPASQLADLKRAVEGFDLEMGLWLDKAKNRVVELELKGTAKADSSQSVAINVLLSDPDGSIATEAPGTFVEIPIQSLIQELMTLMGGGLAAG